MRDFDICSHLQGDVWIARDNCLEFDLKGEGETPMASVMSLLLQIGEERFIVADLKLIDDPEENERIVLFTVPIMSRSKLPKPSVN